MQRPFTVVLHDAAVDGVIAEPAPGVACIEEFLQQGDGQAMSGRQITQCPLLGKPGYLDFLARGSAAGKQRLI